MRIECCARSASNSGITTSAATGRRGGNAVLRAALYGRGGSFEWYVPNGHLVTAKLHCDVRKASRSGSPIASTGQIRDRGGATVSISSIREEPLVSLLVKVVARFARTFAHT